MAYSDTASVQSIAGDYLYLRRPLPLNHLLHRRYRITGVLSEKGGFGMTYRAVDTYRNLNLAVVVKENFPLAVAVRNPDTLALHPVPGMEDTYAKTLQRFEEEAELLSTFEHPNIVRVKAHFSELNTAYYVMPHIGGTELQKALPSPAELSEAVLLPVLRCLLKTLHYMHGYNLMHRDIKPNNILIDAEGTLKLIDFGLVRSTESTHTLTRNYTPGYAPVEQISGKGKSGPWTDLYSLGATCYALITGSDPPDALDRLEEDEYTSLQSRSELQSRYSPALLSGIDRALQVKRADRWQSAQEWLGALDVCTAKPLTTIPEPVTVVPTELTPQQQAQQKLLERNITTGEYDSKLIRAIENADTELLSILIAAGADVNSISERGYTPLYAAAVLGYLDCMKILLAVPGIDVNRVDKYGWSPLHQAALCGHCECAKLLLATPGIAVNGTDMYGCTPLHYAAMKNQSKCVELLLAVPGIDTTRVNNDGRTALDIATRHNCAECVALLRGDKIPRTDKPVNPKPKRSGDENIKKWPISLKIKSGAFVAILFLWLFWLIYAYQNGVMDAAFNGHTTLLRCYLKLPGIDVNKTGDKWAYRGGSPLYWAAWRGDVECVRHLLAYPGIDVNKADEGGLTPLHVAVTHLYMGNKKVECANLLLADSKIDVNKASNNGRTPLYCAAQHGYTEVVRLLLASPKIDVNKPAEWGWTPLDVANYYGHAECARLIREAGGK